MTKSMKHHQDKAPGAESQEAREADSGDNKLLEEVEGLKQQLAEQQRQLLTALADMANLRKRTEKEIVSARKYALEGFSKDILETVDNLERSLQGAENADPKLKEFYTGIELTLKSLKEVLARYDVIEIDPINQPFDHAKHTAIATQPADPQHAVAPNTVIQVVQKGYQLKDRLLRPAMVIVAA